MQAQEIFDILKEKFGDSDLNVPNSAFLALGIK